MMSLKQILSLTSVDYAVNISIREAAVSVDEDQFHGYQVAS